MASGILTPEQIQYQLEHAYETKQPMIYGVCVLYVVVDTIAVTLRIYVRKSAKIKLSWDDYFILASLFFTWIMAAEIITSSVYGIGKHAATLDLHTAKKMSKTMFAFEATFPFLNTAVKLSILFLYRRIFGINKTFMWLWYGNVLWTLGVFGGLNAALWGQCKPISDFWNLEKGHVCRMPFAASLVVNIMNAVGDFLIMILPLPSIWQLQLPTRKKFGVAGIFILGSAVLVISAMRVPMLKHGTTDTDSSWSEVNGILLSFGEPSIGILSACLPVMWPLFKRSVRVWTTSSWSLVGRGTADSKQWRSLKDDERPVYMVHQSQIRVDREIEVSYPLDEMDTRHSSRKQVV